MKPVRVLSGICLLVSAFAAPASAHPAPFSYLDVGLTDGALNVTLVAHSFDIPRAKSEFAEAGMKFSLTFWISDPEAGMDNVRSDVMLSLWDAFKREGIRVPYPVREIRIRGGALPVDTTVEVSS